MNGISTVQQAARTEKAPSYSGCTLRLAHSRFTANVYNSTPVSHRAALELDSFIHVNTHNTYRSKLRREDNDALRTQLFAARRRRRFRVHALEVWRMCLCVPNVSACI